jgi:asparagine synthase (glutamine-hydrolysing)
MYGYFNPRGITKEPNPGLSVAYQDTALLLWHCPYSTNPRLGDKDGIVIYFFGEIYNLDDVYQEAQPSRNPLSVLHNIVLEEKLLQLSPQFNGSFFVVVYKKKDRALWLVSDRFCSKRCYFVHHDEKLAFFPHVYYFKKIGYPADINLEFLCDFLTFKYIAGEYTPLKAVKAVPPATVLEASCDGVTEFQYWNLKYAPIEQEDLNQAAKEFGEIWLRAVDRRVRDKGRLVVPISGGYDSRAVLSALLECKAVSEIHTVTFGIPGTLDFEIGHALARKIGSTHTTIELPNRGHLTSEYAWKAKDTDGLTEAVAKPFLSKWNELREISSDFASGLLGDAMTGKFLTEKVFNESLTVEDQESTNQYILKLFRRFPPVITERLLNLGKEDYNELSLSIIRETNKRNRNQAFASHIEWWGLWTRCLKLDMLHTLSLRERINYLTPFLDNEVVDFLWGIPPNWRLKQKLYESMISNRYADMYTLMTKNRRVIAWERPNTSIKQKRSAAMQLDGFMGASRHELSTSQWMELRRFKDLNYVDYVTWLLQPASFGDACRRVFGLRPTLFRDVCRQALESLGKRKIVNNDYMKKLWAEHMKGERDNSQIIITLVTLELIYQIFAE